MLAHDEDGEDLPTRMQALPTRMAISEQASGCLPALQVVQVGQEGGTKGEREMSQVRFKKSGTVGESNRFNTSTVGEVIVTTTDDHDTVFIRDLDVWVNGNWKDMGQAFKDKDIIPDNYNQWFAVPRDDEERERGYI